MGTPTLFGDAEDIAAPRTPAPESVVRELVGMGVAEPTARGWDARQAYAVLAKKRQDAQARAARPRGREPDPAATPAPPPPPPVKVDRGSSTPERWQSANELEAMLPDGPDRGIPWERRCERLAAGLYVMTAVEWDDVVRGVIDRLRADQRPTPTPGGPTVKCLSLWAPWGSLIVHGLKRCETRKWELHHRGPLLIHQAKAWNGDLAELCHRDPALRAALERMGHPIYSAAPGASKVPVPLGLPFGAIVGRVDVVECYATEDVSYDLGAVRENRDADGGIVGPLEITHAERAYGDFGPDRFAFLTANPVRFAEPIPYPGRQGVFDVPEDVVREALARAGEPVAG